MNKLDPKAVHYQIVHYQIEAPGTATHGHTTCDADRYKPATVTTRLEQVTCDDCRYIVAEADRAIGSVLAGRKPS